jgi:DNA-binding HxlR family transcriptional regulator
MIPSGRVRALSPPATPASANEYPNVVLPASIGVLGKKWSLSILHFLGSSGRSSYSEVLRAHLPLSGKMLAARLSELQSEGYLQRHVVGRRPLRVVYALTEKGDHALLVTRAHAEFTYRYGD